MMTLVANIGSVLLISVLSGRLFSHFCTSPIQRIFLLSSIFLILFIPFYGLTISGYIRGIIGDLSVITLFFLGHAFLTRYFDKQWLNEGSRSSILICIAVVGFLFYPLALGLFSFDPYRLGYASWVLPTLLLLLSTLAWFSGRLGAAIAVILVVVAFDLQLLESSNLWDYLIDPLVTFYAWGWLISQIAFKVRPKKQH